MMQNCYTKSRIPREAVHDQDDRLTSKHINTLKFLQDTASENKDLKAKVEELEEKLSKCAEIHEHAENSKSKIKEIQEQYLNRADEINMMLIEKHKIEVLRKVEEHVEAEKSWSHEKALLVSEIESLKKDNAGLRRRLDECCQDQNLVQMLEQKLSTLRQEMTELGAERDQLDQVALHRRDEILRLEYVDDRNKNLTDELAWANQKVTELEFKIRKLEAELADATDGEKDDVMEAIKRKLSQLHKEKVSLEEKEKALHVKLNESVAENDKLRRALDDSERMRMELRARLEALQHSTGALSHNVPVSEKDNQSFKDFVRLKRELASVKDENEGLKAKLRNNVGGHKAGHVSSLKGDAAVASLAAPVGIKQDRKCKADSLNARRK